MRGSVRCPTGTPLPLQLRTRSFSSLLGARRLVPAIDMLNHHEEHNAEVKGEAAGGRGTR